MVRDTGYSCKSCANTPFRPRQQREICGLNPDISKMCALAKHFYVYLSGTVMPLYYPRPAGNIIRFENLNFTLNKMQLPVIQSIHDRTVALVVNDAGNAGTYAC